MRPLCALALLAVLLLAGCATAPPRPTPGAPPALPPSPTAPAPSPSPTVPAVPSVAPTSATPIAPAPPSIPTPPPSGTLLDEGWEAHGAGWVFDGNGSEVDCGTARTGGCSLRMRPRCCGTRETVTRELDDLPLDPPLTLRLAFLGRHLAGNTDVEFKVITDEEHVSVALTRPGSAGNNGISLDNNQPRENACGSWTDVDGWHSATLVLDGLAGVARLGVSEEVGRPVASCTYPLKGSVARQLRFDGVDYGTGQPSFFDDVALVR